MSTPASRSGLRPMPFGSLVSKVPSDHYRFDLVEKVELANGHAVTVRPILPLDAAKFQGFVKRLSPASRNFRFLSGLRELSEDVLERLTRIDYRTHMALVAEIVRDGSAILIAEARYVVDTDSKSAELAVAVADDWHGLGLAKSLLCRLHDIATVAGVRRLTGETLMSNQRILELARKSGYSIRCHPASACLARLEKTLVATEHQTTSQGADRLRVN